MECLEKCAKTLLTLGYIAVWSVSIVTITFF
nr:MAG TPA: hypothetical protein [Bacteriophage sp.]